MSAFTPQVLEAAAREKEVRLTTYGRKTGKATTVTIWISTDGTRLFVRSGGGLGRNWPQNIIARGEAQLHLGKTSVKVKPRHITDAAEARAVSQRVRDKYGSYVVSTKPGEPLTPGEQASFELIPL